MSEESLAHLLALTSVTRSRPMRPNGTVRPGEVASRRAATSDLEVVSNGWVTVVIQNPESTADGLTSVLNAQCLAHAQWFVCQSWIYILSTTIADGRVAGASVPLHELARYRQNFELDLIESGNLDLMLKDPVLRQVARMFQDAMEVSQHRTTARDRFDVVLRAEQERLGYQSARDSERLQLLFSISAAAAVAALIPSLAAVQWDAIVMVVTVAILCLLLLAFVVNVAVLGRRLSRSRRSRTPTKSRIATSDSMGG